MVVQQQVENLQYNFNMNGNLDSLYKGVSEYFDIGTWQEFSAKMQTPEDRKRFFEAASAKVDLGGYEEFESKLQTPTTESTTEPTIDAEKDKAPITIAPVTTKITDQEEGEAIGLLDDQYGQYGFTFESISVPGLADKITIIGPKTDEFPE